MGRKSVDQGKEVSIRSKNRCRESRRMREQNG